jgi:hypothetical protein
MEQKEHTVLTFSQAKDQVAVKYAYTGWCMKIHENGDHFTEKMFTEAAELWNKSLTSQLSSALESYNRECKRNGELQEELVRLKAGKFSWYSKDEIYHFLKGENYSHEIAEELSLKWAESLQGAFNKGCEKTQGSFSKLVATYESGMSEYFRQHNYRELYAFWNHFVENQKQVSTLSKHQPIKKDENTAS